MKPNVLFILDSFEQGGSERQGLQLLKQLHESRQCHVHLACLQNRGSLREEAEEIGLGEIREYALTSFYDLNFLKQLYRLRQYIKRHDIDVVHTHDFYTNFFGMTGAFLSGVRARVTSKGETEGFRTPMQKRAERFSFRLAHKVIANCLVVQNQLIKEGVDPARIIQHYNGLDLERMKVPSDCDRSEVLKNLGLPENRRFVTIVANLRNAVKDHPMFLKAAARVHQTIPDAAFVVAGEGDLMPSLKQMARELGIGSDVFFIGRCDNVAQLLFSSTIGALSSKAEGFANAILEYMAAGLPVVATDVGGVREAIVENETGHIVSSGDHETMGDRIIALLQDPDRAKAMGERGKAMVQKFSCEFHLKNTLELYEELLGDSTPRSSTIKNEWRLTNNGF